MSGNPFFLKTEEVLRQYWQEVLEREIIDDDIEPSFAKEIAQLLRSKTKSYRYVFPTQLLAKTVDSSLYACCLQAQCDHSGSFDARSLAKHVIVPFERELKNPLGGSPEPYVNNPLRVLEISDAYREQQKNKDDWDILCRVLHEVQGRNDPKFTELLFKQTLLELKRVCNEQTIEYLIPQRIAFDSCMRILNSFLQARSGGARLQAVAVACFKTLMKSWKIFDEVESGPINAADTPGDRIADIECRYNGDIMLAIEVKDTTLTLQMLEDKIKRVRRHQVRELMFLIRADSMVDNDIVIERAKQEFVVGHNIYLVEAMNFFSDVSALIGESGRRIFLEQVGLVMTELKISFEHRNEWANLLKKL